MLVDGAQIAWVGPDDGAAAGPGVRVIDLAGALVTPAFVDAHVHLTGDRPRADRTRPGGGAARWHEALDLVERAARAGRGRPVLGGGWDDTRWPEQRPPTAAELDRAGYGGLVYLARVDAHSAVVSSALLAAVPGLAGLAGLPCRTVISPGPPTTRYAPPRSAGLGPARDRRPAAHRPRARGALGHRAACTRWPDRRSRAPTTWPRLLRLGRDEAVPEVIGYWGELFGIETARELGAAGAAGDLFCDGSLGSHTAALHEPYCRPPDTTGMVRFDDRRRGRAHACGAPGPGCRPASTPSATPRSTRCSTAVERAARLAGRPAVPGTASSTPSTSATPPGSPRRA